MDETSVVWSEAGCVSQNLTLEISINWKTWTLYHHGVAVSNNDNSDALVVIWVREPLCWVSDFKWKKAATFEKHSVWWSCVRNVCAKMVSLNAVLAHVKYIFIWLSKATFGVPLAVCSRPKCPVHYTNCLSIAGYYFGQRGSVDHGGESRAQT